MRSLVARFWPDKSPRRYGSSFLLGILQIVAWFDQDRRETTSETTLATATGLGGIGEVRAFEPPHTGSNYLTNEMVFRVGRKHAARSKDRGTGPWDHSARRLFC